MTLPTGRLIRQSSANDDGSQTIKLWNVEPVPQDPKSPYIYQQYINYEETINGLLFWLSMQSDTGNDIFRAMWDQKYRGAISKFSIDNLLPVLYQYVDKDSIDSSSFQTQEGELVSALCALGFTRQDWESRFVLGTDPYFQHIYTPYFFDKAASIMGLLEQGREWWFLNLDEGTYEWLSVQTLDELQELEELEQLFDSIIMSLIGIGIPIEEMTQYGMVTIPNPDYNPDFVIDFGTEEVDWDPSWLTLETHYLENGAKDWEINTKPDSCRIETYWDVTNVETWREHTETYDALGRLTYQRIYQDDGTFSDYWWDVTNQTDYWRRDVNYSADGRVMDVHHHLDSGGSGDWYYDWTGTQGWNEIFRLHDASGRMTYQSILNDDGRRYDHHWDQSNKEGWSEIEYQFDVHGRMTWQWNLWDSGETEHFGWDTFNMEGWSKYYARFDIYGQKNYQLNTNDDGTSEEWAWDLRNLEKWTSVYTKLITSTWQPLFRETHLDGKAFPFVYGGPPIYTEGFNQEWWNYDGAKHYSYLRYEFQWAPVHYEHEDYVVLHDGRVSTGHNSLFWGCQILWETIYPPIILDLNGDGLDIRQLGESTARFDWNSDGVRDATAWVGPDDGFLIIDVDGDGIIDQTKEISFVEWAPEAETDLEALRIAFDSNGDGVFDAQDDRWGEFRIWQDLNQNGIADAGELKTLEDHGIVSIDLTISLEGAKTYDDGSRIFGTGTFIKEDGSAGTIGDVGLGYVPGDIESQNGAIVSSIADEFMIGITEQDHFVFKQDFGNDIVFGFDAGAGFDDVIDFRDNTFADYEAVLAAAVQVGDDVVLTLDDHNSITLNNVQLSQLHQDDFRFAA